MSHNRTHPQVGDQVQITVGLDKGKRFTVIGGYSDQVELGDENGKFVRSASAVICTVCLPPVANTTGESLAALPGAGQGAGSQVAALFVRKSNHYAALGCDCYDATRDALTWPGGVSGVFHPPCRAWGQLSHMAKPRPGEKELSLWAMDKVRQFGGVLEHPYASRLWAEAGCIGFGMRDRFGGVLVPVMQSWFGHRAPKKSCLYIVGPVPEIPFSDQVAVTTVERMGKPERERTPQAFATWLVQLARTCA